MSKSLYLECGSGISGDMTVAALLDLGADREVLEKSLESLKLPGYEIAITRVKKSGLDACDFNVILDAEHENHDHDMAYLHGDGAEVHDHPHDHEHHHHDDDDDHEHEHHHHHHDHDDDECDCHEHHHDHDEHEHHHDHDEHGEECTCGCHDHDHHHHHHADEVFTSWGKETPRKYTKEELDEILVKLSEETEFGIILRAKGMLPAADGTWLYFDLVPGEYEIRNGAPDYTGRLCVIGSKMDTDKLEKLFKL